MYKVYSINILIGSENCFNGAIPFEFPVLNNAPGKWRMDFCNSAGFPQASVSGMVMKGNY